MDVARHFKGISSEVFPLGFNSSTDFRHRFPQNIFEAVRKRYVKPHNIKNSKNYRSDETHKTKVLPTVATIQAST